MCEDLTLANCIGISCCLYEDFMGFTAYVFFDGDLGPQKWRILVNCWIYDAYMFFFLWGRPDMGFSPYFMGINHGVVQYVVCLAWHHGFLGIFRRPGNL